MEEVSGQFDLCKLGIGNFDSCLVFLVRALAFDGQTCGCHNSGDEADNHLQGDQRPATPVLGDLAEHAMFDLVPFRRARREVRDEYLQSRGIRKPLQGDFPEAVPDSVASSPVCRHEKAVRARIHLAPHLIPPLPDAVNGELCRVRADAHVHEPLVLPDVVYAIGGGLPVFGERKVMVKHLDWLAFFGILGTLSDEIADILLLFRVNGDDGLPSGKEDIHLAVDEPELRIPVHVRLPHLEVLLVQLQAVAHLLQQRPNGAVAHLEPLIGKGGFKVAETLGRPKQGALGRTVGAVAHMPGQSLKKTRVLLLGPGTAGAYGAYPPARRAGTASGGLRRRKPRQVRQLPSTCPQGGHGHACQLRDGGQSPTPERLGLKRKVLPQVVFRQHLHHSEDTLFDDVFHCGLELAVMVVWKNYHKNVIQEPGFSS